MERIVPKGGVELHGTKIPEGTIIGVSAWAMNHDRDIFGDDVECFRPERWIENTPEKLQQMRKNMPSVSNINQTCSILRGSMI
jgi:cytochrome P450